jgi:hypothetical protein
LVRSLPSFLTTSTTFARGAFGLKILQVPFEKFVDLPYYSELEICGVAMKFSFSKKL